MATTISTARLFGGTLQRLTHRSAATACDMTFAVYLPPQAAQQPVPTLYWLSGLTCTDENFTHKSGFARAAAERGLCVVAPDTSPRGVNIPGEDDSYDFGSGAGFYVDATRAPWSAHYNMYTYVRDELPQLVESTFASEVLPGRRSVSGHSMGGHGALTLFLKNPSAYVSVSAFAPICAPTNCPWGQKAFKGYLGSVDAGRAHDASELARTFDARVKHAILVDQGTSDTFLSAGGVDQLQPNALRAACAASGLPLELRMQDGYDHSYYFISSFIDDHVRFHASALQAA